MIRSIAAAIMCTVLVATPAISQQRYDNHGHRYQQQQRYYPPQRNKNNWVAPLVGGLIIGGVVGSMVQQRPAYGYPVPAYRTECVNEPVYDNWNRLLGYEQVCYQVPN